MDKKYFSKIMSGGYEEIPSVFNIIQNPIVSEKSLINQLSVKQFCLLKLYDTYLVYVNRFQG